MYNNNNNNSNNNYRSNNTDAYLSESENSTDKRMSDKNAMGGIKALRQSYEALEERPEKTTNFLSRFTRGLYRDKGNMIIDSKSAVLNKYFGSPIISSSYNNEENRRALQTVFHDNIMETATSLQQIAHRGGDVLSSYKVYELTNKLLSMPIKDYDSKTIYNILMQIEGISDNVALGIPLSSALSKGSTLNNLDKLHRNYMDNYKASTLDVFDESLETFLKAGIAGAGLSGASMLDSIINTFRYVGGAEDMQEGILGAVRKIVPNLTRAEELSVSGKLGNIAGSYASAFALFGVPKTPVAILQYALLPKGIDVMQNLFGISDFAIDKAIGAVGAYSIGKRTYSGAKSIKSALSNMSSGFGQGELSGGEVLNVESYYPSTHDTIEKIEHNISKESTLSKFIEANNDFIDSSSEKDSYKFTDSAEKIFDNYDANAQEPIYVPLSDDPLNSTILNSAARNGHSAPISYLEVSDKGAFMVEAENSLRNSGVSEYVDMAKKVSDSKKIVMGNSILEAFVGEDYINIGNTPESAGHSLTELLNNTDSAFREESGLLYDKLDKSIGELRYRTPNDSPIFSEISSNFSILYEGIFSAPIGSSEAGNIKSQRQTAQVIDAYPYLRSHMDQIKQSILDRDVVSITKSVKDLITSMGNKERDLNTQGRGMERTMLLNISSSVKDFRAKIYDTLSEEFEDIRGMEEDARTSYREGAGRLKSLIKKYFGSSVDPSNISDKLTPEAVYTRVMNRPSFFNEFAKITKQKAINNEQLLRSLDDAIKSVLMSEFHKAGIRPNNPVDSLKILENATASGTSKISTIIRSSKYLENMASRFKEFSARRRANENANLSPNASYAVLKNIAYSLLSGVPLVRSMVGSYKDITDAQKLNYMYRYFKFRVENPSANNLESAMHFAKGYSATTTGGTSGENGFDFKGFADILGKSRSASYNNSNTNSNSNSNSKSDSGSKLRSKGSPAGSSYDKAGAPSKKKKKKEDEDEDTSKS